MPVVAILWLASALAQTDEQWICVPGDGGRWNCGQGGEIPAASELPALEENTPPGPEIFNLPPPPGAPPRSLDAIDLLFPNPGPGAQPGADRFALAIASVSREDEIEDFVDSYGLDPSLVRFVPVVDGDVVRQVILWGSFASPPQAARAMAGMPSAVRAMRPQVAEIATMGAVPRPLAALADEAPAGAPVNTRAAAERSESRSTTVSTSRVTTTPASAPAPEIADEAPATAAQDAVETPAMADDRPPSEPDQIADENPPPAPPPAQAETPGLVTEREARTVAAATENQEPAIPARPDEAISRPSPPSVTVPAERSGPAPVPSPAPQPASTAVPVTTERSRSAPRHRQSDRPSGFQPAPGSISARGTAEFVALNDQHYTVQLTSLKRPDQVAPWLRRHGLSADRVYALQVDEGAGPRTLLLFGNFANFSAAQTATRSLPGSIRSPWVRRISPLKQTLRDSP